MHICGSLTTVCEAREETFNEKRLGVAFVAAIRKKVSLEIHVPRGIAVDALERTVVGKGIEKHTNTSN